MSFDYDEIIEIVDELLPEFGVECWSEVFIEGDYNPETGLNGTKIETKGQCVLTDIRRIYGDYNNLIEVGDQTALASASLELKLGSIMHINNERYKVINPNPIKPADTVVLYKAHVRKL